LHKNWIKKHIQNAASLSTINTVTEEVAIAVIVPTLKAKDRAHAAEQFARQNNDCPKVHYSDTWPASEQFWKAIWCCHCPLTGPLSLAKQIF
jgi:hypothetical protein